MKPLFRQWRPTTVIGIRIAVALLVVACSPFGTIAEITVSPPAAYSGMCDASAAAPLNDQLFAVASDEDSVLRIYRRDRSGAPVQSINFSAFLDLDPKEPESDIEGAARVGDRIYWIMSHGRNKNGRERVSRERFFATQIVTNAEGLQLKMAGRAYEHLLSDLIRHPKLKAFKLAAASKLEPKARGALNIEGLCATGDGGLLIGFRNPIPRGQALIVPLLNPAEVVNGRAANLGEPILLDLGGRGVRDMAYWEGKYIVIAGTYDGKGESGLYEWSGGTSSPRLVKHTHLKGLNPEAIIIYPDKGWEAYQLLSDDGRRLVSGRPCKELADPAQRQFCSVWISREPKKTREE